MAPRGPEAGAAPALLSFEGVGKRYPDGRLEVVVLRDASFTLGAGDHAGLWGARRAGKSTLMRLAAGIELPDAGTVSIAGRATAAMSTVQRARLLRKDIGLVSSDGWRPSHRERVVDLVAMPLVSVGGTLQEARRSARRVLDALGSAVYADELAHTLSAGERTRVMLARALVHDPRLVLVDEPAPVPSLRERDELYELFRCSVDEHGATLLVASDEMAALRGTTMQLSIGDGELVCASREPGTVVPFPDRGGSRTELAGS